MASLLLNILFVSVGAAAGALGGWFLRGSSPAPSPPLRPVPENDTEKTVAQVETLMARLHQLTSSVAADIGEHSSRVQEINHQLVNGADVVMIVERLVHANERMQTQLQAAEKRLQTQARQIESHVKEAHTDPLTRLANRRAFDDEMRRCMEAYQRLGIPFCLMMIDVDHFKRFNDTYGHQVGDEVLKGVARVLRRQFAEHEIVCRYGGEEFAIVFPGMKLEAAIPRAERGRAAIAQEIFEFDGLDLRVAASGGMAEVRPEENGENMAKRADNSLYVSKSSGRNCGYWHDGSISHPMKGYLAGTVAKLSGDRPTQPEPDPNAGVPVFQLTNSAEHRVDWRARVAGFSDRDTFRKDLDRRLAEQQRHGTKASLVLLKIDSFSELLEESGEKAAEVAIRTLAQIVQATKRDMDHAARIDEESFVVLLPGAEMYEARAAAERIRQAIENCQIPVDVDPVQFTVSLGATELQLGDDYATALARAASALQAAQSHGGNCVRTDDELTPACHSNGAER
jgi:diguanylate cyclase